MSLIPRHPSLLCEDSNQPSHPALLSVGLMRADPQPHYATQHCYGRPHDDKSVAEVEDDGFELVEVGQGSWKFHYEIVITPKHSMAFYGWILIQRDGLFLLTVVADGHKEYETYWRFDDLRDRMRAAFGMWRTNTMAKVAT